MSSPFLGARRSVGVSLLVALIAAVPFQAQDSKTQDRIEVVRITTELVQTGVIVLDKHGRFVEGLKPEQFVLKVDGKPVTPSFFELVVAGSAREEKLEVLLNQGSTSEPNTGPITPSYRGRTIAFFIDDLHLGAQSVQKVRKSIFEFVDNQMGIDDQVAVASPSGQIGFLQRFTDLKAVVRAAVNRLHHRPYTIRDHENVPMTEYQALRILQGDRGTTNHFATELFKAHNFKVPGGLGPPSGRPVASRPAQPRGNTAGLTQESAVRIVNERAQLLMRQSELVTAGTLASLESLIRSLSHMSGRKLVFFISDGFFLNDQSSAFGDKLKRITDAAVRSGVIIYSMDARGLVSTINTASNQADPEGVLAHASVGELAASQDGLNALAVDTGGKAVLNTGELTPAVVEALRETSNYYLLAWRPTAEHQKGGNFKRIEVTIPDRPELTVRLPRGFLFGESNAEVKASESRLAAAKGEASDAASTKSSQDLMLSALSAGVLGKGIPTKLSVSFLDIPNSGPVVNIGTLITTEGLDHGPDGKQPAVVELGGVVFNDLGKQAGNFRTRVEVNPSAPDTAGQNAGVIYSNKVPLKPGIYQVRVAAIEEKSGQAGSAAQWIEIPDLSSKRFTLSSLMVGGQFIGAGQGTADRGDSLQFSVDRRFPKGANLSFLIFIYNATIPATGIRPDLESQVKILRNGQQVMASPVRKVAPEADADLTRIVHGANIALQTLPAGRYVLEVTVWDRIAQTNATQHITFAIE